MFRKLVTLKDAERYELSEHFNKYITREYLNVCYDKIDIKRNGHVFPPLSSIMNFCIEEFIYLYLHSGERCFLYVLCLE